MSIQVFKRAAWKRNKDYPGGWEPHASARRTHVCHVDTPEQARAICKEHNDARKSMGALFCEWTES